MAFKAQHALFKAYDVRGSVSLFTPAFMHALSCALAQAFCRANASTVVIGYDVRKLSPVLTHYLSCALSHRGIQVVQLGLITTPQMVVCAHAHQGHGIIATASHSAKNIAGIKWILAGQSPHADAIQALYHKLGSYDATHDKPNPAAYVQWTPSQVFTTYRRVIESAIHDSNVNQKNVNTQPIKLVIDCLNGATGAVADSLLRLWPQVCQVKTVLNDEPDPDFKQGPPDPTAPKRLRQLQKHVVMHQADLGLAFDGDGDRLMVVDERGCVVSIDALIWLLAQVAMSSNQKSSPLVLYDVKCSHVLESKLTNLGARVKQCPTGSNTLRKLCVQTDAVFAGELSAHFIFNDGHYIPQDDALYAGIRLVHWLHRRSAPLSRLLTDFPTTPTTSDTYLPQPKMPAHNAQLSLKQLTFAPHADFLWPTVYGIPQINGILRSSQWLMILAWLIKRPSWASQQVQQRLKHGYRISCLDGIRLDFKDGFGCVRASHTSNCLTVRFGGENLPTLRRIQQLFTELFALFCPDLGKQMAQINPTS